jgi:hypothetical protein
MQIFIPHSDYEESGWSLYPGHPGHLGNQFYREGKTIIKGGWKNHPASKMWWGYRYSLCEYLKILYHILRERGINDYIVHYNEICEMQKQFVNAGKPPFIGNEAFHDSHKSNLIRKDREKGWNWYQQFNWQVPDDLPYIWG